jgi:signal transduction histidine kinase
MRSSTERPGALVPALLGVVAFALAGVAVLSEAGESEHAGLILYTVSIVVGAVAFVLGERARRASAHERQLHESRARLDAELLDAVLGMLDEERESIAHVLHDGPQQLVAAIRLMADAVRHAVAEHDEERALAALARLEEHAAEAADELRRTTGRLHPVVLEQHGLQPALETLRATLEEQFGVAMRFQHTESGWPADAVRDAALYGLAREAAVGAAVAGASAIAITLEDDGSASSLTVQTERGRLSDLPHAHIRTELLRARASSVGGSLELLRYGDGERIEVRVRRR